jgi:hypothetical protein
MSVVVVGSVFYSGCWVIPTFDNPILHRNSFETSCPNVTRLALPTACVTASASCHLCYRHSIRHTLDANNEV